MLKTGRELMMSINMFFLPVWSTRTEKYLFLKSIDEIINLKASGEGDIRVYGSAAVIQALFKYELVDELRLLTFPIILCGQTPV